MSYVYADFRVAVLRAAGGERQRVCIGCVAQPDDRERCEYVSGGMWDAHHVLPKRLLKDRFPLGAALTWEETPEGLGIWRPIVRDVEPDTPATLTLDDLLMDPRNGVPVRRYHHDAIENRVIFPSVRALPKAARDFARELDLWHELERIYGQGRRRVRG